MTTESDLLVDRKRLKRSLTSWRVLAIIGIFAALAVATNKVNPKAGAGIGGDYIALISVEGVMGDSKERDEQLKDILEDDNAKALIVRLDSPGGTALGGEELYLQLRKISKKKPVVGVMRTLCASACYMASLGTNHVVARENTLTGSIGVILQAAEFSRLADKLGITPITIKSGRYKDVPSLTEPLTEDEREVSKELVMDAYQHFVKMIVDRRKMPEDRVRELADGRVYTGSQAYKLQLIDALGGQDEAIDWLKTQKINPKLEVREIKDEPQIDSIFKKLGGAIGLNIFDKSMVGLDGLISIWHPSLTQ